MTGLPRPFAHPTVHRSKQRLHRLDNDLLLSLILILCVERPFLGCLVDFLVWPSFFVAPQIVNACEKWERNESRAAIFGSTPPFEEILSQVTMLKRVDVRKMP